MGILKLTQKISLNGKTKRAVTLARARDKIVGGRNASIAGWGRDSSNLKNSDYLYRVFMKIVSYENCSEKWGDFTAEELEQHEVCALGSDDSQQCQVS